METHTFRGGVSMQERVTRDFTICPRCGQPTEPSISINGGESEFWRNCIKCNTYINTYVPQAHQTAVHLDPHKFILNAGGYGLSNWLI